MIFHDLSTFWKPLGKKSALLGQKQCFLSKMCTNCILYWIEFASFSNLRGAGNWLGLWVWCRYYSKSNINLLESRRSHLFVPNNSEDPDTWRTRSRKNIFAELEKVKILSVFNLVTSLTVDDKISAGFFVVFWDPKHHQNSIVCTKRKQRVCSYEIVRYKPERPGLDLQSLRVQGSPHGGQPQRFIVIVIVIVIVIARIPPRRTTSKNSGQRSSGIVEQKSLAMNLEIMMVMQSRVKWCWFLSQKPFYDGIDWVYKLVNGTLGSRFGILINMREWKSWLGYMW